MWMRTTVAALMVVCFVQSGTNAGAVPPAEMSERTPAPNRAAEQAALVAGLDERELLEDFIGMVWLLATEDERNAWTSIVTDAQRSAFITQFWESRDPTPGTEANEFRALFMKRVVAAKGKFTDEDLPGYRTDRGQFILIYGEEAILEQEKRRLAGDSEDAAAEGQNLAGPRYRIIWTLDPSINTYLVGVEQLTFEQSQEGYHRVEPEITLTQDALLAHRDLRALFATLRAGSRATPPSATGAVIAGGPTGEDFVEDPAEVRLSTAGEAMRRLIDEGVPRQEVGLRFETAYFPAPDNNTYMVVAFEVDKDALTFGYSTGAEGAAGAGADIGTGAAAAVAGAEQPRAAGSDEAQLLLAPVHVFGFVLAESTVGPEQLLYQLVMEVGIDQAEGTPESSRTYSFGMTLVPGSYRLAWGVIDDTSERLTTLSTPFEVPNFGTGELTLTSVLVATPPMVERADAIDINRVYEGVRIGNIQLDVDIDRQFERDDTIELLYFVMGAGIDPIAQQPQLEVEHVLLRGDTDDTIARLPTQTLNYFAIGQQIPLGQVNLIERGGQYRILIKVKDVVSGNELTHEVPFTIAGDGSAQ